MNRRELRHALGTPINHILGYAELLADDDRGGIIRDRVNPILESGWELLRMVDTALQDEQSADLDEVARATTTPLETIARSCDDLITLAPRENPTQFLTDLNRIRAACDRVNAVLQAARPLAPGPEPLDLLTEPHPSEFRPPGPGASHRTRPFRVLIVDDEEANRDILQRYLEPGGVEVVVASGGQQALELISSITVDLVLLDVRMPGTDGFQVCRLIRQDPSNVVLPVVMVTAGNSREKADAIEAGADDLLAKPIQPQELLARVRSLLRIKEYHDTARALAAELEELNRSLQARVQEQLGELERLGRLRRFLSPQLADIVVSAGGEALLESHRREITVVEVRLRGFPAFAEATEPELVLAVLREYHAAMGEEIYRFEGTTGHISGDRLLVFFNDPIPCPDPAGRSVRMALAMRDRLDDLTMGWGKRGYALAFCAGIETGYATLGTIGFKGRSDYAAIGPVTEVAAGLCQFAEDRQILITQRVCAVVEELLEVAPVGDLAIAGLRNSVPGFSVERLRSASVGAAVGRPAASLTVREQEVLTLIAQGLNNRQIADKLVIGVRTAETHVERILRKLNVENRAQAMIWANEHAANRLPDR